MRQESSVRASRIFWRLSCPGVVLLSVSLFASVVFATVPESRQAKPKASPSDVVRALALRGKNLSALKAVMAVSSTYDRGKSSQEIRGFLLYRRPSDFRFQGIGPGGNSLFEMVVNYRGFELYVPAEGKLLRGGKKCFRRRFPDVAELEGLIPLALLQWKQARLIRVESEDANNKVIRLNFKGRVWRATLEPKKLLVKRLERIGPNSVDLTADFADFTTGEYGWLPRRFEVQAPKEGWRTVVRITRIEVNPFLVEKNFKLEPAYSPKIENCK